MGTSRPPSTNYLQRYAEAETEVAAQINWPQSFNHVLVIPTFDEPSDFLQPLLSFCAAQQALLLLVINQPDNIDLNSANLKLWQALDERSETIHTKLNLSLFKQDQSFVLAVDRFQPGHQINPKHGVGLARKIGADIASTLIARQIVKTHWIHCSDADTTLPSDYFYRTQAVDASAAVYPFRHCGPPSAITTATQQYEQTLQHYVNGLRYAGSPYAFHTIGSCLAINAEDYCRARGFPKRAGGEDFYLLNKLAKLGPVYSLSGEPISITARRSHRVPFGTGPAVEQILNLKKPNDYQTYDPQVFAELKQLLNLLSQWWEFKDKPAAWYAQLTSPSRAAVEVLNIEQLFTHLHKQAHNPLSAQRHCQNWFDGFRTLKFIHLLQRNTYPPLPLTQAIAQAHAMFASQEI